MKRLFVLATLVCLVVSGAASQHVVPFTGTEVVFLQINDVYEVVPLRGGRTAGMARVAQLRKMLLKENPHTYTVLAGDFLSPSAVGTSVKNGKRIAGAQMVDVMNTAGVDLVTFGNHEFDIRESELQERIEASRFGWVSANVKHRTAEGVRPFGRQSPGKQEPIPEYVILDVPVSGRSTPLRIGVIAVTLTKNRSTFVEYEDPFDAADRVAEKLRGITDCLVGLTHLTIDEDRELARRIPDLRLIMGGHEHRNMVVRVGETVIAKADANAKTAWVHRVRIPREGKPITTASELISIDDTIPDDSTTAAVANGWMNVAFEGFRALGLQPEAPAGTLKEVLDGREASIRYGPNNLGVMICRAMLSATEGADGALLNSGSVRIDDELAGQISEYDIIRTLPFGGRLHVVEMTGALLHDILEAGRRNIGSGGYLQMAGISPGENETGWLVAEKPLAKENAYRIVLTDFLLSGKEGNLEFLTRNNAGIKQITEPASLVPNDIRTAVVKYLRGGPVGDREVRKDP